MCISSNLTLKLLNQFATLSLKTKRIIDDNSTVWNKWRVLSLDLALPHVYFEMNLIYGKPVLKREKVHLSVLF